MVLALYFCLCLFGYLTPTVHSPLRNFDILKNLIFTISAVDESWGLEGYLIDNKPNINKLIILKSYEIFEQQTKHIKKVDGNGLD